MALRNVVHRRNHKERSQPTHRSKFGLLEKHKDYIQRARDHNVKKARIQKLAQKASLRNPDEFNFGMIKNASNDLLKGAGLHVQRRSGGDSEPLENDLVAILKSQDLTYVRGVIRAEEKQMEEIREFIRPQLGFMTKEWIESKDGREDILVAQGLLPKDALLSSTGVDNQPISLAGKKTVWVENVADAVKYKPEVAAKPTKRYSLTEGDDAISEKGVTTDKSAQKRLGFLVSQLEIRQQRIDTLNDARLKLETVKALMTTKGTHARKIQTKTDALKAAVVNGKVTPSGLSVQAKDEGEEEEDEMSLEGKKKTKVTLWKWGRERKR